MKKPAKKTTKKQPTSEYRPYRVLFLVVLISVTCLVLFAAMSVSLDR